MWFLDDEVKDLDVGKLVFGMVLDMAPPGLLRSLSRLHHDDGGLDAGKKESPGALFVSHGISHKLITTSCPEKTRDRGLEIMGRPQGHLLKIILKITSKLNFVKEKIYNWGDHFHMINWIIRKQFN
jgi:hypothetical protein